MNNINIIKSEKFKTITIKVVFYNEFNKENATSLSLLTRLLLNTTKKYNTKKKLVNKLYDLYDASVFVGTTPSYKTSITTFTLSMVNESYVKDNTLFKRGIDFLYEVITNPNIDGNKFNEEIFEEEKRILIDEIQKVYNNKNRYALRQAIKNMCPNELVSVSSLGTIEDLQHITPESIYIEYQKLINSSKVVVYAIGDFDDQVEKKLSKFSKLQSTNITLNPVVYDDVIPSKVNYIKEEQDVNQTKLVMGYRIPYTYKEEEYFTLQLFSLMFGGLFCSNLFQTVREEHSLAYDIGSQLIPDSKIMIVSCGIDNKNIDETISLINEELDKYKDGIIDDDLLEIAKSNAISDMDEIEDSQGSYTSFLMKTDLLDQNYSIKDIQDIVRKITKEHIQEQAKRIYLDTIFVLTNK